MIKTIKTNIFKRLLIAAGMGIKALTNHKHTPKTIMSAIKFISSLIKYPY
jgi:hypothetical protein